MSDSLLNLCAILKARPADCIIGWRHDTVIRNGQFLQRIVAWQNLLRASTGQKFALYLKDSVEFGAALLGAWQAGKTVWLPADTLAPSNASLKNSVDGFLGEFPADCHPLRPTVEHEHGSFEPILIDGDFPALVVHTSGTTGTAQAIPKKLAQLSCEVTTLEKQFGPALGDADIIATVSHQHIYGLLFRVLWPLTAGRAIHAHSQNFPEELAQILATRPCALIATPAHLKRLSDHLDWRNVQDCLRNIFSSGGPLPAEVAHAVGQLLGRVPIEVYGSSETGGIAWRQRSKVHEDESWNPLPQVDWRIAVETSVNENFLEIRSPHLSDSNWLRIADLATASDGGRFLLQGRGDRIAKIEEKRISLDAIEALLIASPLVAEVKVLVCDDASDQRQKLAAFVVPSGQGKQLIAEEGKLVLNRRLRDMLVNQVEPVAYPRRWRYLNRMPLNAQGKTTHSALLALLDAKPTEPLLRLIGHDALNVQLEMWIPPDLLYFDGHFPDTPILPGVVQVDWAIGIARRHFTLPLHFSGMAALKFQHVVQPGNAITLELAHHPDKNSVSFRYFSPLGQHASGRLLFSDASSQQ